MLYLGIDQHRKQLTVSIRNEVGGVTLRRQVSTEWVRVRAFFDELRQLAEAEGGFVAIVEVSGMLLFKKKFLAAIRAGEKTQTIRLWKHRRMRGGQRSYIPGVGYIRVTTVEEVEIEQLTDDDARPDGFASADELRGEIARLYPQPQADSHRAYRVVFRVMPPEEAEAASAEKK